MNHPSKECQRKQEEFLKNCPEAEREFHSQHFRIANAAYVYHQQAVSTNERKQREYFDEWLQGLPSIIAKDMKEKGFELCKSMMPFT